MLSCSYATRTRTASSTSKSLMLVSTTSLLRPRQPNQMTLPLLSLLETVSCNVWVRHQCPSWSTVSYADELAPVTLCGGFVSVNQPCIVVTCERGIAMIVMKTSEGCCCAARTPKLTLFQARRGGSCSGGVYNTFMSILTNLVYVCVHTRNEVNRCH